MKIAEHAYEEGCSLPEALMHIVGCFHRHKNSNASMSAEARSDRAVMEITELANMEAWPEPPVRDELSYCSERRQEEQDIEAEIKRIRALLDRLNGPDEIS